MMPKLLKGAVAMGLSFALASCAKADTIASSVDDWSVDGIQGENGWTHGWYNLTLDEEDGNGEYDVEDFIPFLNDESFEVTPEGENHWDGTQWRLYRDGEDFGGGLPNTGPWTRVGEGGNPDFGHPNGLNSPAPTEVEDPVQEEHWVIRRWESNFSGTVEVTATLAAQNVNCGNGTTTHLFHNGELVETLQNENDTFAEESQVTLAIAQGDFLDYALSPEGPDGARGDSCDGSFFGMTVDSISVAIEGDFNANGELDLPDVNLLNAEVAAGTNNTSFDLNDDNLVNADDLGAWVKDLRKTWFGDANLDSEFNSSDLVVVFQAGKFEQDELSTWDQGDWNGDLRFNSGDLVKAFQDGGFEQGPPAATHAVPEPSSAALILFALLTIVAGRRTP